MNIRTRVIEPADYPQLEDFLYHAIYLPPGTPSVPRELIFDPEIYIYVKDFDPATRPGDCGVVAERDGKLLGIAWTRIIPAYGHIDDETPELAISVLPECRGQGLGTVLMERLFDELRAQGYTRTSLSVQKDNPAVRFYRRLGYETAGDRLDHAGHEDWLMVKEL